MTVTRTLEPQYAGAVPRPLIISVEDGDGVVQDLTGGTATFRYKIDAGAEKTASASINGAGAFVVTWVAADFARAGTMRGVGYVLLAGKRETVCVIVQKILEPPASIA